MSETSVYKGVAVGFGKFRTIKVTKAHLYQRNQIIHVNQTNVQYGIWLNHGSCF